MQGLAVIVGFEHLDDDVLSNVFSILRSDDILQLRCVCKSWNKLIINNEELWLRKLTVSECERKPLRRSAYQHFLLSVKERRRRQDKQKREELLQRSEAELLQEIRRRCASLRQKLLYCSEGTFAVCFFAIFALTLLASTILVGLGLDNLISLSAGVWLLFALLILFAAYMVICFLGDFARNVFGVRELFLYRQLQLPINVPEFMQKVDPVDFGAMYFGGFLLSFSTALSVLFAWGTQYGGWTTISVWSVTIPQLLCLPVYFLGYVRLWQDTRKSVHNLSIPYAIFFLALMTMCFAVFCISWPLYASGFVSDILSVYVPLWLGALMPVALTLTLLVRGKPGGYQVLVGYALFAFAMCLLGTTELLLYLHHTGSPLAAQAAYSLSLISTDLVCAAIAGALIVQICCNR